MDKERRAGRTRDEQRWQEHFEWVEDFCKQHGHTPVCSDMPQHLARWWLHHTCRVAAQTSAEQEAGQKPAAYKLERVRKLMTVPELAAKIQARSLCRRQYTMCVAAVTRSAYNQHTHSCRQVGARLTRRHLYNAAPSHCQARRKRPRSHLLLRPGSCALARSLCLRKTPIKQPREKLPQQKIPTVTTAAALMSLHDRCLILTSFAMPKGKRFRRLCRTSKQPAGAARWEGGERRQGKVGVEGRAERLPGYLARHVKMIRALERRVTAQAAWGGWSATARQRGYRGTSGCVMGVATKRSASSRMLVDEHQGTALAYKECT